MRIAGIKLRAAALLSPLLLITACTTQSAMNEGLEPQTSFAAVGPKVDTAQGDDPGAATIAAASAATPSTARARASNQVPPVAQAAADEADDLAAPAFAGAQPSAPQPKPQPVQVASLDPADAAARRAVPAEPEVEAEPVAMARQARAVRASSKDHECLARAMYFESNRSSREGMVAVGTVVMNRLEEGKWGRSVCSVVGSPRQFAPGVLSRSMANGSDLAYASAASVLKGERHPRIYRDVMFFHTAGYKFPYDNMHYVAVAGGNSFYEKRRRMRGRPNTPQHVVMRQSRNAPAAEPVAAALVEPARPARARPFEEAAKPGKSTRRQPAVEEIETPPTGTVAAAPAKAPAVAQVEEVKPAGMVTVPAAKGGRVGRPGAQQARY